MQGFPSFPSQETQAIPLPDVFRRVMSWRIVAVVSQGWSETVKRQASTSKLAFKPIFREEDFHSSGWGLMYTFTPRDLAACSISSYWVTTVILL